MEPRIYNIAGGEALRLQVQIDTDAATSSKRVTILAPLHKRKRNKITWCYSSDYQDHAILADRTLRTYLIEAYGV